MKKFNLFVIAIVAVLEFNMSAKAEAPSVALSCQKTEIAIGESTNCTVSFTGSDTIKESVFNLSTSRFLTITNVVPNSTKGWSAAATTDAQKGKYAFEILSGTGVSNGAVFSFTVTLNENAKELGEKDTCGELCISGATLGNSSTGVSLTNTKGTGTCYAPVVVEKEKENPPTGAFANYAIIIASIIVAGAAVVIARKSSKFFRV